MVIVIEGTMLLPKVVGFWTIVVLIGGGGGGGTTPPPVEGDMGVWGLQKEVALVSSISTRLTKFHLG
jgi:hypothetical protein